MFIIYYHYFFGITPEIGSISDLTDDPSIIMAPGWVFNQVSRSFFRNSMIKLTMVMMIMMMMLIYLSNTFYNIISLDTFWLFVFNRS